MIVLDASAAVELLLRTSLGQVVAQRIATNRTLHAPHLIDLEVTQVIRRLSQQQGLAPLRAQLAVQRWRALQLMRYPHAPLLSRIWDLRENLTSYDAAYVALAESLRAPLLTLDQRVARSSGHRATVELLA